MCLSFSGVGCADVVPSESILRFPPASDRIIGLLGALALITSIALGPAHYAGATIFFESQITAHDAAAGDQFGFAVSVSRDTVIVGAPFDDDAGSQSGGAYIFQRNEGGIDAWGEVKKLIAADVAEGDIFGFAVAISGDLAVVGAPYDDGAGTASGAVYLFERDLGGSDNWGLVQKFAHSDTAAGDVFGYAVAINGNTLIVGAPGSDGAGSESGAVYVFERDLGGSGNWGEAKKRTSDDAEAGDNFGFTVSVSGDTVAVGAPFTGGNIGSAYVFERALGGTENWGQVKRLRPFKPDAGDQFGYSVAVSQDSILVGARFFTALIEVTPPPTSTDPSPDPIDVKLDNAGAAYFFERNAGAVENWKQIKRRVAANRRAGDQFGRAVAIRGDHAVVGSLYANERRDGATYVYERSIGGRNAWGRLEKLVASDGVRWDEFGSSVSINADTVVAGAPETDAQCPDDRDCDSGLAYVYTVAQTRGQQRCINALNSSFAKVASAHAKAFSKCAKNYARTGTSAEACLLMSNSSVERAEQRTFQQEMRRCTDTAPSFGDTDAETVNDAAMQLEANVIREIFGSDLDVALATTAVDKDAAKCQRMVITSIDRCMKSTIKEFNRCKKKGFRKAEIRTEVDLEECWGKDSRGVVARACDPVGGKLATRVLPKTCVSRDVDLSSAFPGCGTDDPAGLSMCVDQVIKCRTCAALNRADDLLLDCDFLDDGGVNSSCP